MLVIGTVQHLQNMKHQVKSRSAKSDIYHQHFLVSCLALGPGPFATALEYAASTTATIVGKPEPSFFQEALKDMQVEPENAILIGDVSCEVVFVLNGALGFHTVIGEVFCYTFVPRLTNVGQVD